MHDLKYANEILSALKKNITAEDNKSVIVINVKLSPFSHVRPEGLNETLNSITHTLSRNVILLALITLPFSNLQKTTPPDVYSYQLLPASNSKQSLMPDTY